MTSRRRLVTAPPPLSEDDERFVAAARLRAARMQPYLAAAVYGLVPVAAPGLGTFAVDSYWRLYLDLEQARAWGVEASAAVLLHEAHHVLRDHHRRSVRAKATTERQQYLWNLAGDAAINDDLIADGVPLPDPLLPTHLGAPASLLEEAYYRRLITEERQRSSDPHCGSGAGGAALDCEVPLAGDTLSDDAEGNLPQGLDEIDADAVRRAVAHDVEAAAAAAKEGGPSPRLTMWADHLLRPRVPWPQLLRGAFRHELRAVSGTPWPTYSRPDRRADAWPHLVRPGNVRSSPEVAVVIDTSASMTRSLLDAAVTEIDSLLRRAGVRRLTVLNCDHEAAIPQQVRRVGSLRLTGGGGTDLRVGIAAAAQLDPKPSIIAVLTDGLTPWPAAAPSGVRIIAVVIGSRADLPLGPGIVAIRVSET